MSVPFDPHHAWLGIHPREQPADFYRLLGLARFEPDPTRIAAAADERMRHVSSFQNGPWGMYVQPLLSELSAAKTCLLTPAARYSYDAALRQTPPTRPAAPAMTPQHAAPLYHVQAPAWQASQPGYPAAGPPPAPPPVAQPTRRQAAVTKPTPEQPPPESAPPAPWWRPIVVIVAIALILLTGAAGWGIYQALHWNQDELAGPIDGPPEGEMPTETETEPPPEVQVLLQEGSGEVNFPASLAALHGMVEVRTLVAEEVLANWSSPEAAAQWDFRLVTPGFFQIELVYATQEGAVGAEVEVTIGPQHKVCELRPTGGRDKFLTDAYTIAVPSSGRHTLALRPGHHPPGDWLVLRSLRLIPVARNTVPPAESP